MKSIQELLNEITDEELATATRKVDAQGIAYYEVKSRTSSAVWEVRYIRGRGFTCTCPSGERAFVNTLHNNCHHCRVAFKAAQVRRALITLLEENGLSQEEAEAAADARVLIDGKPASVEELTRIYGPRYARPTESEMQAQADESMNNRPFQFMR